MSTYTRTSPYSAHITSRSLLNEKGSSKETFHVELHAPIPFQVGDSIGIYPTNERKLIDSVLQAMKCSGGEEIFDPRSDKNISLDHFLTHKANLSKCTSAFLRKLKEKGATGLEELLWVENKTALNECLQTHHLGDILRRFPGAHLSPQDLTSLLPLLPRFYSIASSPHMHPEEIHLTVALLRFTAHGEHRYGVGSRFLCIDADPHTTPIPIYVQPSNGFSLPDPDASIILIGPGTGVAPFRAFLQERLALQHRGRSWLFFGERNERTDFYYKDFFRGLEKQDRLRLNLAFSRDQTEKIYVQHKLWEERASLYDWLQNGAYLFVCGDAENMARDVENALIKIGQDQGSLSEEDARLWIKSLRKEGRYLQDVY